MQKIAPNPIRYLLSALPSISTILEEEEEEGEVRRIGSQTKQALDGTTPASEPPDTQKHPSRHGDFPRRVARTDWRVGKARPSVGLVTCMCVCVCVCMCIYIYIEMCVYIYMYVYIYIYI